jgi:hypothetical protein
VEERRHDERGRQRQHQQAAYDDEYARQLCFSRRGWRMPPEGRNLYRGNDMRKDDELKGRMTPSVSRGLHFTRASVSIKWQMHARRLSAGFPARRAA